MLSAQSLDSGTVLSRDGPVAGGAANWTHQYGDVANTVKSVRGAVICCMAIPYGGLPYVAAGSEIDVAFRFRCSMIPDVYFLNAGVAGIVNGQEIYLHRIVDALMIRVNDWPGRVATGCVDPYTDAQFTVRQEPANKAA